MARLPQSRTFRSMWREQQRQLRVQGSASVLARSGLSVPDENTTQVDGNLVVLGDFTAQGKVSNTALVNPVVPGYLFASGSNFALTTTLTNILTQNVTVPDGCTQLATSVTGRVFAYNNTAGLDYLYGQTNVAGFNGNSLPLAVSGSNGSGTNISPFAVLLTGLTPGSTVAIQMAAATSFAAWAANTGNTVELSGLLLWFR